MINTPLDALEYQRILKMASYFSQDGNIQTDLGLKRSSFPELGLLGDSVFTYDLKKELELQTEHDELWFKEYKKKKRAHIQEIVDTSFLSQEEKEWLHEGFMNTHPPIHK